MMSVLSPSLSVGPGRVSCCSFCQKVACEDETSLVPNEEFLTWASVGALVEGHVLILPKRHVLNASSLEVEARERLADYVRRVRSRIEVACGNVAIFEHGPSEPGDAAGCSIDHAHLHMLPWNGSLVAEAMAAYPDLSWSRYQSDFVRGMDLAVGGSYLLVQDPDGRGAVGVGQVPSQALRKVIATSQSRPEEWDWKTHPQIRTRNHTIQLLIAQ